MTTGQTPTVAMSQATAPTVLRSVASLPSTMRSDASLTPVLSVAVTSAPVLSATSSLAVSGGSTSQITAEASETISALKPVVVIGGLAAVARSGDVSHRGFVAGISSNAATQGNDVTIRTEGEITDSSWSWNTSKPCIFYGDGVLTQTPPAGWCQPIARVQSSVTIFVNIQVGVER